MTQERYYTRNISLECCAYRHTQKQLSNEYKMIKIWVATRVQTNWASWSITIYITINCLYLVIYFVFSLYIFIKIISDSWSPSKTEPRNIEFICCWWKKFWGYPKQKIPKKSIFTQNDLCLDTSRCSFERRLQIWNYFGWKIRHDSKYFETYGSFMPK
jgi:hypothetical protein